ncbi:helix-turn-helix domain-containing protein [Streptomyces caatingaensis]|uniref:Transcriptional regulator n=1 Tax=Streptomyces caatingaensis TaxID=1678637 RepID=A0A0K9XHU1_9ACTN|nr:helix-turn-helix domain-containing protein [Streptomyces caatingaensis]KNB52631.1 hypothetical protein AC230_08190 [Streptomyces caatingaensis]
MYDLDTRRHALSLVAQGRSLNSVSQQTGISRYAIRQWLIRLEPKQSSSSCLRCDSNPKPPQDPAAYAYLLGLYLGDGCISKQPRGTYALRIARADAWPGLIAARKDAVGQVRPENSVCAVRKQGCVMVTSTSRHWPCFFPQHGPGKKHQRVITLESWQQDIVDAHPWEFVRGLVHSDGCRVTNWATRVVAGTRKRHEYTRYFFTNKSDAIRRLFTDTLDALGVEWRPTNAWSVSVARRPSVALMDTHIGPKH